jgi:peptidyl-prolyl cis-trans isomerase D
LVTKYSDDLPSKLAGGDLGWVGHGDQAKAIDEAIWKTSPGAITELVETDYGFEILKVEEKRPARARPLDEVRASIEQEIRAQEAPAYAANKAREIVSSVKKESKLLDEVVRSSGGTLKATNGFLTQDKDPDPALKGLTQNVFMTPTSERLTPALIELGDTSVIVQIVEFKEPSTPLYEEIKGKLASGFLAQESSRLARAKAEELLKAALNNPASFSSEANSRSAKMVGPFSLSREEPTSDKFPALTADMRKAILSAESADKVIGRVFSSPTEHTILKVVEIKAPSLSDPSFKEKASEYRSQAAQELTQKSMGSMLAMLKERATIEINPSIVTNQ